MITRSNICPVCKYKLLAREGDDVFCLSPSCDWRVERKRVDDFNLPEISEIKKQWS